MTGMETTAIDLAIEGMTCASCVARVQSRLVRVDGVTASVNLATERAHVVAPAGIDTALLVSAVEGAGYRARVIEETRQVPAVPAAPASTSLLPRVLVSATLSIPVLLLAMVPPLQFAGWEWVALVLAAPVVGWGGWPFHRAAGRNLRHGATTMDTLVSLGTLVAFLWSLAVVVSGSGGHVYVEVAAVVTTFLLLGRYAEARSRRRAGSALRELVSSGSREVSRIDGTGVEERIPVERLAVGDSFAVRPGERIAADGVVVEGSASVDASAMTGESLPVDVVPGDAVSAGTIAAGGSIVVRATSVGSDTRLARIAAMVEDAQLGTTRAQRLADRVSAVFVPVVIGLAVLVFAAWWIATGDPGLALSPAVAVLIVACPCALGLATPIALLVGTSRAAQRGILLTGPDALERAGRIDTVVFDKTGTLTTGSMTVTSVTTALGFDRDEVLALAGAAERGSEHPLGRAIAAAAPEGTPHGEAPAVSRFEAVAGSGVRAEVGGRVVVVGRAEAALAGPLGSAVARTRDEGATAVVVTIDGVAAAVFGVSDPLRPDAAEAVVRVRVLGAETIALSGDHEATVRATLAPLPLDRVIAGVTPEQKAAVVERMRASGRRVAMVGDGVNDAAALARADLGIALGSGSDIAIEAADVTLLRAEPALAADALLLSRRMLGTIRGNLFWAFAYNVAALPVAALGLLNPMIAGAAMAFSSVFVVLNSLRLRRF